MRKLYFIFNIATLLLLTGTSIAMSNNDTKFEWDATESAPEHYPMKIIQGTFIYHGETEQGLYIPSGGTLSSGWGHPISSHSVGEKFKPLPDRLKIIFFSFAEKQFYQGEFILPYDKILALFRDGVANPKVFPNGAELPSYSRIMVGVAPGGAVAVWITGIKTAEVFFGQAKKIEMDPSRAFNLPFKSKEQSEKYIREVLEESISPGELESLKKDGIPFGLWVRYRNRYEWLPTFTKGHQPENIDVVYINGENITNWALGGKNDSSSLGPAPKKISFTTSFNDNQKIFIVHFDELETMSAFEKLGANGQKLYLEFEPKIPKTQTKVRLYNDKESISLKKTVSEDW